MTMRFKGPFCSRCRKRPTGNTSELCNPCAALLGGFGRLPAPAPTSEDPAFDRLLHDWLDAA